MILGTHSAVTKLSLQVYLWILLLAVDHAAVSVMAGECHWIVETFTICRELAHLFARNMSFLSQNCTRAICTDAEARILIGSVFTMSIT